MSFCLRLADVRRQTLAVAALAILPSCANVPLHQGTSLSSYTDMAASGGSLTKAKLRVDPASVLKARTVRIMPTSAQLGNSGALDPKGLALVTNAIDRALCVGLSDRFQIVAANHPADLVVHARVTDIVPTNRTAAATSAVASLGASVALAVPIPRIPIGLGGLSVEAEAVGQDGAQKAAMLWSRGANMLTTRARISTVGDAYSLSSAFGGDFSRMLVKGRDPFKGTPTMPSMQKIKASLGGAPKYDACKAFGSSPGITGAVAGQLGLPPGWSDKGAAASQ
ncbi:DUF3313 domain-containing protein [Rhizobium sp. NXC24]|uniref:DUF3313 domain-containing protein n=1 Tax=Rhizobium sp. NXC24 TaxID=2048897 RepID=UPI000CDF527C|nr:DUF3313 domain-containing protein [Rhizobium sp. NXC24]AVA24702.1 hypothetical protein NXC24_PC00255 [Rhizobium sp. NXC24]